MVVDLFRKDLHQLMKSVTGLLAIVIVDKDGVPIIEAHRDIVPEHALRPSFLSVSIQAAELVTKLGMGKCHSIYCDYENYQVVTFNKVPSVLVVVLIADSRANTGVLLSLGSEFDLVVNELKKIKI